MSQLAQRLCSAMMLTAIALAGAGCGSDTSGPTTATISGKVTFHGEAVGEGSISFEAPASGHGGEAILESDGSYKIELPVGGYNVTIRPPMVEIPSDGTTDPSMEYKVVANIPEEYRSADTSDLKADVPESGATADFDLQ